MSQRKSFGAKIDAGGETLRILVRVERLDFRLATIARDAERLVVAGVLGLVTHRAPEALVLSDEVFAGAGRVHHAHQYKGAAQHPQWGTPEPSRNPLILQWLVPIYLKLLIKEIIDLAIAVRLAAP